jgi:hypothetical protein
MRPPTSVPHVSRLHKPLLHRRACAVALASTACRARTTAPTPASRGTRDRPGGGRVAHAGGPAQHRLRLHGVRQSTGCALATRLTAGGRRCALSCEANSGGRRAGDRAGEIQPSRTALAVGGKKMRGRLSRCKRLPSRLQRNTRSRRRAAEVCSGTALALSLGMNRGAGRAQQTRSAPREETAHTNTTLRAEDTDMYRTLLRNRTCVRI